MLTGKTLTDFTNLFSPNDFKRNDDIILDYFSWLIFKMAETNNNVSMYPNLSPTVSDDQQFKLNKINEIRDYFVAEIKERELMSKKLSKCIAFFDYLDKSLIVLSLTTGSISVASFANVIGAPVGIVSTSFSLAFSVSIGIIRKLLKTTRNKKKKHNKIVKLARSKLNSIQSKISKALMNNEIQHEDFKTIINEEKNTEN